MCFFHIASLPPTHCMSSPHLSPLTCHSHLTWGAQFPNYLCCLCTVLHSRWFCLPVNIPAFHNACKVHPYWICPYLCPTIITGFQKLDWTPLQRTCKNPWWKDNLCNILTVPIINNDFPATEWNTSSCNGINLITLFCGCCLASGLPIC